MSFTLEQPLQSFADKLCLIGVKWVDFDPLPKGTNRCFISYTTAGYKPTEYIIYYIYIYIFIFIYIYIYIDSHLSNVISEMKWA